MCHVKRNEEVYLENVPFAGVDVCKVVLVLDFSFSFLADEEADDGNGFPKMDKGLPDVPHVENLKTAGGNV